MSPCSLRPSLLFGDHAVFSRVDFFGCATDNVPLCAGVISILLYLYNNSGQLCNVGTDNVTSFWCVLSSVGLIDLNFIVR